MRDQYRTLSGRTEARVKVQRSEFIAAAFPVTFEEEFFERLAAIQRIFFDASHHCWGFRLFHDGTGRARSSDAGEPGGTAGKPILNTIESRDYFDVAVVVTRYFGGTKLGTGGLARAYRDASAAALDAAPNEERFQYARFTVEVPYAATSVAYRLVDPPNICLRREEYGQATRMTLDVRTSRVESFLRELEANQLRYEASQSKPAAR